MTNPRRGSDGSVPPTADRASEGACDEAKLSRASPQPGHMQSAPFHETQPRNAPFREMARRLRRSGKVHFTERRTLSVERHRKAQSVPHASRKGAPCDPQIAHTAPLRHVTAHRRLWGQPPARLRGTVKNGPTGQMRSRNPPLGCGADRTRVRKPGLEFGLTERRTLRWTSHGKGALWPSRLS